MRVQTDLLVVLFRFVPHVEPLLQGVLSQSPTQTPLLLDLPQGHRLGHHLYQPWNTHTHSQNSYTSAHTEAQSICYYRWLSG